MLMLVQSFVSVFVSALKEIDCCASTYYSLVLVMMMMATMMKKGPVDMKTSSYLFQFLASSS